MKSRLTHLFTLGALSCTLFGASPETALAKPQMQRMPTEVGQISKSPRTIQNIGDLIVGEPVAYVTDALNYAKIGRARGVTRTAVYATVVITSPTFYSKPGRSSVAYANGILNLVGKTGSEYLVGDLNVIRNGGDLSSPFQGMTFSDLSTRLTIRRDGFVSIRTTIKGRRSSRVETTSFKSNGADGFLWGIDPNNGKPQLISVMLSKSVFPLPGAQPANAPAEPTSAPPAAVPRGMKVKVSGQIRVTNSDDGIAFMGNPDNTVEMFGTVKLNNHDAWNVGREKAGDHIKGDVIPFDGIVCNVYFDNPDTQKLTVSGSLYDRDGNNPGNLWVGNNDDSMWKPSSQEFDLKQILEERGGTITVAGDRKSENADVKITIQKIADIN